MSTNTLGNLLEKRRNALVEFSIANVRKTQPRYNFLKTPADLFELLRLDPLDNYPVKSSWVAEATSCAQQFIHAAYRNLEPGYEKVEFDKQDLSDWELDSNYPDWAARQMIAIYPENFITPFVRQRKTSLFKSLENNLNQTKLTNDSVQMALGDYLQSFEQTCNLDVISAYMDGDSPAIADYYFVGRQRVEPYQYFWRRAQVELAANCTAINPAAWSEWQPMELTTGPKVLDIRPVFWSGRLCVAWAEWQDEVVSEPEENEPPQRIPPRLNLNVSFMTQGGQWSPPQSLYSEPAKGQAPTNARLLVTVWADHQNPKGKLGVLLRATGLEVAVVRDVLFRPVVSDNGDWLSRAADQRFTALEQVQHPLRNQPGVVSTVMKEGPLSPWLDIEALAYRVGDNDVLWVRGLCRPTGLSGTNIPIDFALQNPAEGDEGPVTDNLSTAGGWYTRWQRFTRPKGTWTQPVTFEFGAQATSNHGRRKFELKILNLTDFALPFLLKNTADAAQFLALNQASLTLKYTRLNSLFGPELVQRSNISVDAVLDWDTQFLSEPAPEKQTIVEPNGMFDGANGLFFWELFFHLPHLIATRLRAEDRFLDSQKWLHYLFDPQAPEVTIDDTPTPLNPKPKYWRCRPLASGVGNIGFEVMTPTDPDAIGYGAPKHFGVVAYLDYVKNLVAWGDWYYRQLTRDALVAAKLCYVQAEFLMGRAPTVSTTNLWEAETIGSLLGRGPTRPTLFEFEKNLDFTLADFPVAADIAPRLGLLGYEPFKAPINEQLLAMFELPTQRLSNLRNNLTLDGKPLDIPLFSPPTDPNQLLRDLAAGGQGGVRPMGGRLVVGAFRWRVSFEAASRAVQTLQDYGNQVLRLLELRDRAEQEEMQQDHLLQLGTYAQTVQEQTIEQLLATRDALAASREVAEERAAAYARRYEENISAVEYEVMDSLHKSKKMSLAASVLKPIGASIAAAPNIFGLANGGFRLDAIPEALSQLLSIGSSMVQMDADKQATTEAYRRRRGEWQLQRDQALAEVRALDAQIVAQEHAVRAARLSLEQTLQANRQALTLFGFLKKRASNAELYGWLLGQLKALHYQAYDAVVSLCMNAQSSLSAETGDYQNVIPLPQVWLDNRHGLTAGEHLRAHLVRMEREYLQRYERRLELVKTVSLRQLFDDEIDKQPVLPSWSQALQELQETGKLQFHLTQLLFDRDHPGHYCRQISSVEVDLPVLTGPYENVRATLVQTGSMVATLGSRASVEYLHQPQVGVAPADVQINLRSGQQIALSMGINDNGITTMKPDEGLLNPFESTGAVSRWELRFPWPKKEPQAGMLASLTDIIVRIRYTAKAGETPFMRAVEDLVTVAESPLIVTNTQGENRHE
ncbi:neuraminidase-like domain-containing protein [Pseudomonas sp. HMWF021]|uniref:Tc toxin subunit A-related protein n=1 Tax=Pseudomonas sp. HMWF021 TaxID=2056857 RepID=UPI000D36013E|nr:neuraminidase-like domain-containing protein [Pseudomonas sp. HMWF021]PTT32521.1 insecticidal toxin complex protein TcaB2 [Pseudomonas sp. HMWF021]